MLLVEAFVLGGQTMTFTGVLVIVILLSPFVFVVVFAAHDRANVRRDRYIEEKSQHIAQLFQDVCDKNQSLARIYLESHRGEPYPYDLFMIEYRGGKHIVDTIWLPIRDFIQASDDELKQVLAAELSQPGKYTIPDWEEAVYEYIIRGKQNSQSKKLSVFRSLLQRARIRG
jgi:hypothetical protein